MKVFIAGATGAIGRPLISRLVGAGHEVVGMTSSERGLKTIKEKGAEGVVANALDAQAVQVAMNKVRPDAVIEELTSLPERYTPGEMRAAGARRYIVQSTGFFYAPGSGLATEAEPLALDASPAVSASVRTYTQIEQRVLGSPDLEGVALRYGFFLRIRDMVYSRWRRGQPGARSQIGNRRFRAGCLVMGARRGCCSSDGSSARMYSRCLQHRR